MLLSVLLLVTIFPVFSYDKTDPLGFQTLSNFAPTKLIRFSWTAILIALNGLILVSATFMDLYKHVKLKFCDLLIFLYVVGVFFSIIYNTPGSLVAWYRGVELSLVILSVFHFNKLYNYAYTDVNITAVFSKSILKLLTCIILLLLFVSIFSPELLFITEIQGRKRLGGYIYSPNFLASILSITQVANYYVNVRSKRTIKFWLTTIIIFSMTVMTDSRTGLFTLLTANAILLYIHISCRSLRHNKLMHKGVAGIGLLSLVFGAIVIHYAGDRMFSSLYNLIGMGKDPLAELLTLNNRVSIYITAVEGISENFLFGVGYVEGVRSYLSNNYQLSFWLPPHVHNGVLEILLAQGLVGGLPFFIFIILSLGRSIKYLLWPSLQDKETLMLSTVIILVLIISLTTVPFGNVVNSIGIIFLISTLLMISNEKSPLEFAKTST